MRAMSAATLDHPAVRLARRLGREPRAEEAEHVLRRGADAQDAARRELADVVVVNDGTEADLAAQVDALWAELGGRVPGPA